MAIPRIPAAAWVVLGTTLLWLLTRNKTTTAAQASIQGISIDGAPMGAHAVAKTLGATVVVTVRFTNLTKNAAGVFIAWRYRVRHLMATSSPNFFQFQFLGPITFAPANFGVDSVMSFVIPPDALAGVYSVTAFLQAETSDSAGNPTGVFTELPGVSMAHPSAISITVSGPATPSGSISTVDVAQAILKQMG